MATKKKNNSKPQSEPVINPGKSEYQTDISYYQSLGYSHSEAIKQVNESGKYII